MTAPGKQDLVLTNAFPTSLRCIIGTVAAACMGLLVRELGPGVWPPSVVTPFFAIIVLGGVAVCAITMAMCAFGSTMRVRLTADEARILHVSPLRVRQERLRRGSLRSASVMRRTGDEGPDTFHVVLALQDGRTLRLPDQPALDDAKAAAERFATVLGGSRRPFRADRIG